jgi:AcrR family transcriptional regulator
MERGRRQEYTEATRRALLDCGRRTFAEQGFQAAGIEAISRAARVTRGAFYHHFADKTALFDAVVVEMQAEAAERIAAVAKRETRVWDRLAAGMNAFLDVSLEAAYGRIVVLEAPAVLGEARYREVEEAYPLALLRATLRSLERRGELRCDNVDLLGHMVDAMLCELAVTLPRAPDAKRLRQQGLEMIDALLRAHHTPRAAPAS